MRKPLAILFMLAASSGATHAVAATSTADFNAHVKLSIVCTTSATPLDFGTLPGLIQGTETTTATLLVTCSKGAAYALELVASSGAMSGQTLSSEKVNYNATLTASAAVGTGVPQLFSINGTLPAQTTPTAQDYQEARTVNITY